MASNSQTTLPEYKYDVFLSFRGPDTRRHFIPFLYNALVLADIRTFKDDKELENGQRISPELLRAIEESKFAVVVISPNYAESAWCLDELVKIMELQDKGLLTVIPIFYDVDPGHLRRQIGEVAGQFKKHEERVDHETVLTWRQASTALANIVGECSLKRGDDSKMIDEIVKGILRSIDTTPVNGSDIVGIDKHMKAIFRLVDLNSKKGVRVVGVWATGGKTRSVLSKFVYQKICQHFQSHCFMGNLKRICEDHHMSHLHKEFLARVQGEGLTRSRFENQKVLLVADNVTKLDQLDALAEDFNCFGPGSLVIVTTQDRQLLKSYRIKLVYEVERLRFKKVRELIRRLSSSGSLLRDDEAKIVDGITEKRSKMISATPTNGNYLIGIDEHYLIGIDDHMNKLYPLLHLNSNQGVEVVGIWGRGSISRSVLARHVYENISYNFESRCFLEDVGRISLHCRRSHLQEELYSKMQGEGFSSNIPRKSLKTIEARLRNKKILVVANDVDNIEQLDALAEEFIWFGPGSRIIITTQDRSLLSSSGVESVYEVALLRSVAFKH
ncbi:Disease resistance protein (TIR-NBS class) [Raphanus sativus]|uniref:Disease resistance protein RPS6-like n=1 Tax=Raphanus sativus TaxID=3726 RepID=A0A6J0MDU6_RAPSA|nr:disease resistance protein RPS6-like [Raphanus sativus]KAJ4909405.1 Disease resistance protein (TIR-NBS class) [Raphanus sativus]